MGLSNTKERKDKNTHQVFLLCVVRRYFYYRYVMKADIKSMKIPIGHASMILANVPKKGITTSSSTAVLELPRHTILINHLRLLSDYSDIRCSNTCQT